MEIREAEIKDLDILKEFEQEVIRYERPFAPNLKGDPITYYDLIDLMEREDAHLIIATIDGEAIASGYALIQNAKHYKTPDKHAYLGFMYVSPKHRGKGVNGKIVEHLIDWANKRNITEIVLEVYNENESALKAYKKKGFKPDLLKMRINTETLN